MLVFLLVLLLLAALLEYLSLRSGTSCIEADFQLSRNRTEAHTPLELVTTVRNDSRLPISFGALSIAFPLSAVLPENAAVQHELYLTLLTDTFRLWWKQSVTRTIQFEMDRRGVYTFFGRELSRGDFLGIHLESERFYVRRTLIVYPQRLENDALTEALGAYCGELSARRWLIRDPVLTLGIREYTGNEPMHTISWIQTARRGDLTVREFDFTRSLNCCIVFSVHGLDAEESELLDRCCGAVRTICEALLASGVEARVFTNAALSGYPNHAYRSVTAAPNREDDLLEVLARVTGSVCFDAEQLVLECLAAQTESAAYVLVAAHDDAQTQRALSLLEARSGMGALLVAVDTLGGALT